MGDRPSFKNNSVDCRGCISGIVARISLIAAAEVGQVFPHCCLLCSNTCSRVARFRVATSCPARRRIFAYLAFARARAAGSTSSGGSTRQVRTYCNRELVRANCACTRVKSDCTCFAVFARVAAIRPLAELSPRHCRPVRVRSYRPQV